MIRFSVINKFVKKYSSELEIVLVVVIVFTFLGGAILQDHNEKQLPDYKKGYCDGFNEMNSTKQTAALQIRNAYGAKFTITPVLAYADGYIDGYTDAQSPTRNAIKTLGYDK